MAINFVQGDTAPQLRLTLKDSLLPDQALDLTGAVVKLHIRAVNSQTVLTKTAQLTDATAGIATITWADTDWQGAAGTYEGEVEVYYSATNIRETVYELVSFTLRDDIA
jgi:deferrochelatase/peroxidase EfeB